MLILSDHGNLKNETKSWLEADHPDLKTFTETAASALLTYREKFTRQRAVEKEEQRIAHEQWLRKRALEEAEKHEAAMDSLERQRIHDLLLADEWERLHENTTAFVQKLETTWLELGPLSPDQRAWLDWARAASDGVSMRSENHPQIDQDGPFDRGAIPLGGPYPKTRDFPRPPTMPKMTSETSHGNTTHSMGSDPYPYWFRNR